MRLLIPKPIRESPNHKTCHFQDLDLGFYSLSRNGDVFAAEESYHRMGDGWNRAQQSFGIYRTSMIEMVDAEDASIYLCQDVDGGIVCIAVAKYQDSHIDDNQSDDGMDEVTVVQGDGKHSHYSVAEGDALQDSPDSEVGKV